MDEPVRAKQAQACLPWRHADVWKRQHRPSPASSQPIHSSVRLHSMTRLFTIKSRPTSREQLRCEGAGPRLVACAGKRYLGSVAGGGGRRHPDRVADHCDQTEWDQVKSDSDRAGSKSSHFGAASPSAPQHSHRPQRRRAVPNMDPLLCPVTVRCPRAGASRATAARARLVRGPFSRPLPGRK